MTLHEVVRVFFEEQEYKGNRPATLRFYQENFRHFLKDTGITELHEFNEATIRGWLIAHKDLSRTTLATYDRALRVLAGWLYASGYVPVNPMARLPKPKPRRAEIVTFTPDEVRAMLKVAATKQFPLRERALIMLLLDTGIRAGEAVRLRLHDVRWDEGWLLVDGKAGERTVPFGRKAKLALRRYLERERKAGSPSVRHVFLGQHGDRLLTSAITHQIGDIAREAKVKATKRGPHTFRHTFAVEFIRAGGDAFSLQRILGHTTLDMTRRYVHLAHSDLRTAHRRYAPGDRFF